ncbi:PKD domain-containing protein [Candidatus Peregrinibacteria bacterium]|nr:PKD domain-containing protein [Candidatus Peregrinibacteria bacterium]
MKFIFRFVSSFVLALAFALFVSADFNQDLSLAPEDIRAPSGMLLGDAVRIYATIRNHSDLDLAGVVKFYDETAQRFIGTDQPVSAVAGGADDVFIDWEADTFGNHNIAARVIPWIVEGDDPENNKAVIGIYVDRDSDRDGVMDREDTDDDNDGVPDRADAFPLNPKESMDTDRDGTGNNADMDDDNDGASDIEDDFPLDPNEQNDRDNDGTGDHSDLFPDDPREWSDLDKDGLGDNADTNDWNKGPIAEIVAGKTKAKAKEIITFNALKSSDPDGDVVSFEWDFGDGEKANGVVVDHFFKKPGYYDVALKVMDDKNESREAVVTVHIAYKWQAVAFAGATLLLFLLLFGGFFVRKNEKKKPVTPRRAPRAKPVARKKPKAVKKNLPKRKK